MGRELTEEELMNVKAGMPNGVFGDNGSDELSVDDLDNVLGGAPREVAYGEALENQDLFREKTIDDLVQEQIKREEMENSEDHSYGRGR